MRRRSFCVKRKTDGRSSSISTHILLCINAPPAVDTAELKPGAPLEERRCGRGAGLPPARPRPADMDDPRDVQISRRNTTTTSTVSSCSAFAMETKRKKIRQSTFFQQNEVGDRQQEQVSAGCQHGLLM